MVLNPRTNLPCSIGFPGLTSQNGVLRYKRSPAGRIRCSRIIRFISLAVASPLPSMRSFWRWSLRPLGDDLGDLAILAPPGGCLASVGSERPDGIRVIANRGRLGSSREPSDGPDQDRKSVV